jgi:hypothetical protein
MTTVSHRRELVCAIAICDFAVLADAQLFATGFFFNSHNHWLTAVDSVFPYSEMQESTMCAS